MTPKDLALLHASAFSMPRPWSETEFADLLANPHVFVVGDGRCFAMGRVIADEVELLTIATAPLARRKGLGRDRLTRFEEVARDRGARTAFLEVAATNTAAIALYMDQGYAHVGQRKRYYRAKNGTWVDAVVMKKAV